MKHFILKVLLLLIVCAVFFIIDVNDRNTSNCSRYYSKTEAEYFFNYKEIEESYNVIQDSWADEKYRFPREKIDKIVFYRNIPFVSRLLGKTLNDNLKSKLIQLINNPECFNWIETTWSLSEADYFFRFYNNKNEEIGKFWILKDGLSWTEIRPWSPSTKFGAMTKEGEINIEMIVKEL